LSGVVDGRARIQRVVAFDVDGTLTTRDCVVPFLLRVGGWRSVGRLLACAPGILRAGLRRDRDRLKGLASRAVFAGRRPSTVTSLGEDHASRIAQHWLREDVLRSLEGHLEEGDRVVLVSASFEAYLLPLARHLGVADVLGTRLAVNSADDVLTGELEGPNCRAAEKVHRLESWMEHEGIDRSSVVMIAYGNSAGDREMLAMADVAHWVDGREVGR
jgi:phosphatidylglycerophosphatase C